MKKTRIIMAAMLSATVMVAAAVSACAEDAPEGYVTFYADKNTIGQGLIVEPVEVPFYEGDSGIDIVQRAADVLVAESDYGNYIEAFADTDNGAELPAAVAQACPAMFGRNTEGYLSAYDYTAESGWNWFLNGESALVGISGYEPADGDVVVFRFTVYGYGSDLGIDNSSWGGAAALVELTDTSELARLAAANKESAAYDAAIEVLGTFGASQADIDAAVEAFAESDADVSGTSDKQSPETGAESIAAVIGITAIAGAVLAATKKR